MNDREYMARVRAMEGKLYRVAQAILWRQADEHCGGMLNALPITEADAQAAGKQPCPICVSGDARIGLNNIPTPTQQSVEWTAAMSRYTPVPEEYGIEGDEVYNDSRAAIYYATMKGAYYHENPHCSGMKDALPWTFEALWRENRQALRIGDGRFQAKQPCPMCVDWESPVVNVYAMLKGRYYHIIRDCSGMKNATAFYTAEAAEEQGKTPCPVCLPDDDNLCWATPGGRYYHIERECMGMKDAWICMESSAQRQGKEPCPVCWK